MVNSWTISTYTFYFLVISRSCLPWVSCYPFLTKMFLKLKQSIMLNFVTNKTLENHVMQDWNLEKKIIVHEI